MRPETFTLVGSNDDLGDAISRDSNSATVGGLSAKLCSLFTLRKAVLRPDCRRLHSWQQLCVYDHARWSANYSCWQRCCW